MKVSIVTVVYNNKEYIKDSINSVLGQRYNDIEYIIIDGGSNDGTLEIIKEYGNKISKIVSEKDNGLYDAMNKGFKLATGDIIGILSSDDVYIDDIVISKVVEAFKKEKTDCLYADLLYVNEKDINKIIRHWAPSDFIPGSFIKGWHPPHPTFFVKQNIYKDYGYIDDSLKVSADFELMLSVRALAGLPGGM